MTCPPLVGRFPLCAIFLAGIANFPLSLQAWGASFEPSGPEISSTLKLLQPRIQAQLQSDADLKELSGFQFTNRIERSHITFEHNVVDDCSRDSKATVYDHGTGIAAADVDGDGKIDLYFVNQIGGCELWRNRGNGEFENITDSAGVGLKSKICVAASFADLDNDGDPDLFVTMVKMGNVLFENIGRGKFKEVTSESGLGFVGHSSGAIMFDYDKDGLLDIFVANVGAYTTTEIGPGGYYKGVANMKSVWANPTLHEPCVLYRNLGNLSFRDTTDLMKPPIECWSGDASFCDLNEDGFPDLYVLNMNGANEYYQNISGRAFVDKTRQYFPRTPQGAMGIKFFDFNQDGKIDLFITDMHSDMSLPQLNASRRNLRLNFETSKSETWCGVNWSPQERSFATNRFIFGNAFFLNQGNGQFIEISDTIGPETFWPWGMSVADLNADGFEDAFITAGMGYPFRYAGNSVLLNDEGRAFCERGVHFECRTATRWAG